MATDSLTRRSLRRSQELQARLHAVVPGGAHTYAKGDDQYPEGLTPIIARGQGSHVWDVDGNEYLEYGSGLRAVTLGHGEPRVVAAAYRAMQGGLGFVRPSAIELECAEGLLDLIDAGEMVKFAKNGSDVTTAAVKLARAVTGRNLVAICDDQPFLSTDDWFIGRTAMPAGVPEVTRDLTVTFHFNDLASLEHLFASHPGQIACVVLEPAGAIEPAPSFLADVRAACTREGALLVFDEMITGFRWHLRGAQHVYGVAPDLSTFGKALGNGFSVSALVGRRDVMERGGLHHSDERVFLLSTTHGAETSGLAAASEVMRIYREEGICERLAERGERLARGVQDAARIAGVEDRFLLLGRACNLVYATLDSEGRRSQAFRTLFLQELLARGILAPSFVTSVSLSDADIDRTSEAVGRALRVYREALEMGVETRLRGRSVKPVFRPFA